MSAGNARRSGAGPEVSRTRTEAERVHDVERMIIAIGSPPDLEGAACTTGALDPDCWFSYPASREGQAALAVCSGCPVREACLEWALELPDMNGSGGILGGMSQAGLRAERARRRLAAAGDEVA